MPFSTPLSDPMMDTAADAVIAAFDAAEEAGKSSMKCYSAAVSAWCRAHPDQTPAYAARQAVEVILSSRRSIGREMAT